MTSLHPYEGLPPEAFWRSAISGRHVADIEGLWTPLELSREHRIATAGSCFAQHIGRNLQRRGANYLDLEPAPPFLDAKDARRFGFGLFSCRYGNIYTSRQLLQLFQEAWSPRQPARHVWRKADRFYDAMRPGVDPAGVRSRELVTWLRHRHLDRVREMFETLDLFVFTLGLTECWESIVDGTAFPIAPGTIAGRFDPSVHRFRNLRHAEVLADLKEFYARLREVNPGARMLLTVSPVPLTATASKGHVLAATLYSKSVLRAVAGDMATDLEGVSYFPSYEIVASHPARGMFFDPDLRSVNEIGVATVMRQFFSGALESVYPERMDERGAEEPQELVCEEERSDHGS